MTSKDAAYSMRTALAQLNLEANMATPAAPPSDPKAPNNANPVTEEDSSVKSDWVDPEELLTELREEAAERLPAWENDMIYRQSNMAANLLHMSAKAYDIRTSLLELTTCLETSFYQHALIKSFEIENLKAQIEFYKTEVDLLRQENYELEREKEGTHGEDASGEEVEAGRRQDA